MVNRKLRATAMVVEDRGGFMALLWGTLERRTHRQRIARLRIVDYIVSLISNGGEVRGSRVPVYFWEILLQDDRLLCASCF